MKSQLQFGEPGLAPLEGATLLDTEDGYWLSLSRHAYHGSTDWFNSSVRRKMEDSMAMFFNQHPAGSKYHTEAFRKRSKLFRPKTRTAIRNIEAAANISMFATADILDTKAVNPNDPEEILGSRIIKSLVNYRLRNTIPWFTLCTGGVQDGLVTGVILSKQSWEFREVERKSDVEYIDRRSGQRFFEEETEIKVIADGPIVDIVPIEQLKFDSAASWYDPMAKSPYLIHETPWYVYELKARMGTDLNGPEFRDIQDRYIFTAVQEDWDSLRRRRDNDRVDRFQSHGKSLQDFQIVWVREYIMDRDGEDWVWWTLGGEVLLSEPVILEEVYAHGRPWKMGMPIIETHRLYPSSPGELIKPLQEEANEIANLRLDNIKQAVLRRWIVGRNHGVDVRALQRGIPGGIIYADDINQIRPEAPSDVTRSSYEEQDRLNLDIDDLTGSMSAGTILSQRNMNETAKGMDLTFGAANQVQEFLIRTIMETWVRGVMTDLVVMEGHYETDQTILRIAAAEGDVTVVQAFRAMGKDIDVSINVAYGAMTPQARVDKIRMAVGAATDLAPKVMETADQEEIVIDIMAAVGIQARRYFPQIKNNKENPQVKMLKQTIRQLTQVIQGKQVEQQGKKDIAMIQGEYKIRSDQLKGSVALQIAELQNDYNMHMAKIAEANLRIDSEMSDVKMLTNMAEGQNKRQQLFEQRRALNHNIVESERQFKLEMAKLILSGVTDGSLSTGPMDLPGDDRAGIIARDNYDLIPGRSQ